MRGFRPFRPFHPRLIFHKGCAPAQSPTQRMLSSADVVDGSAAAHRSGEVGTGGDPVLNGAAGDAEEIAQQRVGGAEQATVMGEFAILSFVERRLSGVGHLSILFA